MRTRMSIATPAATAFAAGLACAALGTGAAGAATTSAGGGAGYTPLPVIDGVSCVSLCASGDRVQASGTLRLRGRKLEGVRKVIFHGGKGWSDDVAVRVRSRRARALRVQVPLNAVSGPLTVWKNRTTRSDLTRVVVILPPPPPRQLARLSPAPGAREPGAPRIETGTSATKAFFDGQAVRFSYRIRDDRPVRVKVELVRLADGSVARSWEPVEPVLPGEVRTISWNGYVARGQGAPGGRYSFRLTAESSTGATARSSRAADVRRDAFDFYGHIFPVRGAHDYGDAGARFGSARSGHSHQGQDVFAKCGVPLVAARGGVVRFNQFHSAAGFYLVIDGLQTGWDYSYMHLQQRSPFKPGDRVKTGQQIGRVGETGNARGCHLHYEMWGAPGWYKGGSPFDPYKYLKLWDSWS